MSAIKTSRSGPLKICHSASLLLRTGRGVRGYSVVQPLLKIHLNLSQHILLICVPCPFELLEGVRSLKEELAVLKRTAGKQGIQQAYGKLWNAIFHEFLSFCCCCSLILNTMVMGKCCISWFSALFFYFFFCMFMALNTVLTGKGKLHWERFCSSNCTCQGRSGTDAHGWINKLWLQRFRTRILTDPSHDNTSGSHSNIICCWTLRACEYRCAKG